jgi:cell division protein FtsI (penicillin-binding protein 3)
MINTIRMRMGIVFFLFCTGYSIIIFNLFIIQIWNTYFFSTMGEQQYAIKVSHLPTRAPILDRSGNHYLASNKECVSAFLVPDKIKDITSVTTFLKTYFPLAEQRLINKKESSFMYIKRRLKQHELAAIQEAQLPDIYLLQESSRFYPIASCNPLIGFTDIDNEGKAGAELQFNDILEGTPTIYALEKDARSGYFYFDKQMQEEGVSGSPIRLTIDSNLQFLVDELVSNAVHTWHAQQGSALILDPQNGDVLALSSYPYTSIESDHFTLNDTKNHVISDAYELGSVIKVFAALAALEEKVVSPDELIDCKNTKTCIIEGRTINTWQPHGIIPFTDVIAFSNNIGIAQVAKRLGPLLYDHYLKLGFGKKTGIQLPGEHIGFVNHPTNWSKQSIISLSYGYEISATLLQLACAFAVIANNGYTIKPRINMQEPIQKGTRQLYSTQSLSIIKDILKKTTEYGTGHRAKIKGYDILCKTGTANLLINGQYEPNHNIFTCAVIVERESYKRIIISFIKEVAKSIAEQMIIHERAIV